MANSPSNHLDLHLEPRRILFEDDDLIAVDKPPGLPSQGTLDPKRFHLARAIELYLASKSPGPIYVGQHHRLDVETSGVIVFTKSRRANAALAAQFREHRVRKTYVAIAAAATPKAPTHWHVNNHLAVDPTNRHRMKSVRSGGDRAKTDFALLQRGSGGFALVQARPHTGRRHQIRVHLAEDGQPIFGDKLYGGASAVRVMLHAETLELTHPITSESLSLQAPRPNDFQDAARDLGLL